jgi:AbrB family looped-hinge helix DNA binding protein
MKTVVSSKGQMVIPSEIRRRLSIEQGTELEITVPQPGVFRAQVIRTRSGESRKIKFDKSTGWPVFDGKDAPRLTSEQVAGLLEEFP